MASYRDRLEEIGRQMEGLRAERKRVLAEMVERAERSCDCGSRVSILRWHQRENPMPCPGCGQLWFWVGNGTTTEGRRA